VAILQREGRLFIGETDSFASATPTRIPRFVRPGRTKEIAASRYSRQRL